jgi:hypothetical protein
VQVVADIDGSVISLSGTDRSICIKGRRVIAEGPPAAVPAPLLARMETHAVEFSRLVSAATVLRISQFREEPQLAQGMAVALRLILAFNPSAVVPFSPLSGPRRMCRMCAAESSGGDAQRGHRGIRVPDEWRVLLPRLHTTTARRFPHHGGHLWRTNLPTHWRRLVGLVCLVGLSNGPCVAHLGCVCDAGELNCHAVASGNGGEPVMCV